MNNNIIKYIGIFIIFLASVSHADLSDSSLVPQEEMTFAKNYLSEIRGGNFEYISNHASPELSSQLSKENFEKIVAYFPTGQLISTTLIGSQVNTFNDKWQGNFAFEYEFESGWAVANLVMQRIGEKNSVMGFNVLRTEASQKELNRFELEDKSIFHYLILVFSVIVPVFILISLVFCIKTPIAKRKWLWVLFILGGIGTISLNWSTGGVGIKILQYQLFGVGASSASEYAPWIITVGFPLGAIVFWSKRKSFIEKSNAVEPIQQGSD